MPVPFLHSILPLLVQFSCSAVSEFPVPWGKILYFFTMFYCIATRILCLKGRELNKSHKWDEGICYRDSNCHLPKKKMMAIKLFLKSRILTDLATADYRAVKQNSRT